MKIAYLCQSYPPMVSGAARVVKQLAEGVAARGHDVVVMAASNHGRARVTRRGGLRLVRLRSFPNPFRAGQHFVIWPRNEIVAELQAFQPDMLHLHDFGVAGLSGLLAARKTNTPVVLTFHLLPETLSAYAPPVPGLRRILEAGMWAYSDWVGQHCRAVATPSGASAEALRAHSHCRPVVLTNGVDLNLFSPMPAASEEGPTLRRKYGLDPDLPILLYVGRIDVEKRVEVVIRAAAQAMRSAPAQLLVVGDGIRRAEVIQLSEQLHIRKLSHFPGFVRAADDLPGLYRLASAFVMASEVETQGIAVLEAAASGLPIIAVRATSMPELVEDGVTGYLVTPGEVDTMADRLTVLLRRPDQARAMGLAARARTYPHSLECSIEAHEQFYHATLASAAVPA
jgi:1,2-diacylglycerol 3-alpha-glucosyltransferase